MWTDLWDILYISCIYPVYYDFHQFSKIYFSKRSYYDHTSASGIRLGNQKYSNLGSSKRTVLKNIAIYLQQLPLQISFMRSRYLLCLQCLEHCARKSGKSKPAITLKTQTFLKHMGIFFGPKNFCFLWEVGGGFSEWQVHWPTGEESLQN